MTEPTALTEADLDLIETVTKVYFGVDAPSMDDLRGMVLRLTSEVRRDRAEERQKFEHFLRGHAWARLITWMENDQGEVRTAGQSSSEAFRRGEVLVNDFNNAYERLSRVTAAGSAVPVTTTEEG